MGRPSPSREPRARRALALGQSSSYASSACSSCGAISHTRNVCPSLPHRPATTMRHALHARAYRCAMGPTRRPKGRRARENEADARRRAARRADHAEGAQSFRPLQRAAVCDMRAWHAALCMAGRCASHAACCMPQVILVVALVLTTAAAADSLFAPSAGFALTPFPECPVRLYPRSRSFLPKFPKRPLLR